MSANPPKDCGCPHTVSAGGIAGLHAEADAITVRVGSTTDAQFNTVRAGLIPVACWRVDDVRFDFGSSFVRPEVAEEIQHLWTLREEHKKTLPDSPDTLYPPLTIFGHADPVGDDDFNKTLSGRRATAIYGLLTHNASLWEQLYAQPFGDDQWGKDTLATMLAEVQRSKAEKSGASPQPDTDKGGSAVSSPAPSADPQAVRHYAASAGQRKQLFLDYMDSLCTIRDGQHQPRKGPSGESIILKLEPKQDFLAQGQNGGGKGDYQGCGEFNPGLIFSSKDEKKFAQAKDKSGRNAANASNRRVLILLFRVGSKVDPHKWPCPSVKDGTAGCRKRFWSDGEKRRTDRLPDAPRKYEITRDTFACRFYDRFMWGSPCEQGRLLEIRVVPNTFTRHGNVMAYAERLDGKPLPEVNKLVLGGKEIDFVLSASDGRIYFLPPKDGPEEMASGHLPEAGMQFSLETDVRYVVETKASTESLRQQMAALRQCAVQYEIFAQKRWGNPGAWYTVVVDDGHLRLADALDNIIDTDKEKSVSSGIGHTAEGGPIVDLMDTLYAEHRPAMDQIIASYTST